MRRFTVITFMQQMQLVLAFCCSMTSTLTAFATSISLLSVLNQVENLSSTDETGHGTETRSMQILERGINGNINNRKARRCQQEVDEWRTCA